MLKVFFTIVNFYNFFAINIGRTFTVQILCVILLVNFSPVLAETIDEPNMIEGCFFAEGEMLAEVSNSRLQCGKFRAQETINVVGPIRGNRVQAFENGKDGRMEIVGSSYSTSFTPSPPANPPCKTGHKNTCSNFIKVVDYIIHRPFWIATISGIIFCILPVFFFKHNIRVDGLSAVINYDKWPTRN